MIPYDNYDRYITSGGYEWGMAEFGFSVDSDEVKLFKPIFIARFVWAGTKKKDNKKEQDKTQIKQQQQQQLQ